MRFDLLEQLRFALGLADTPLVMRNLEVVDGFFRHRLRLDPMTQCSYLAGIDFSKDVRADRLPTGTPLSRHASVGSSSARSFMYFTSPGTSPTSTGTTFHAVQFIRYEVIHPVKALISYASDMCFAPIRKVHTARGVSASLDRSALDGSIRRATERQAIPDHLVSRRGGGVQYIVASADMDRIRRIYTQASPAE